MNKHKDEVRKLILELGKRLEESGIGTSNLTALPGEFDTVINKLIDYADKLDLIENSIKGN